MWGKLSRSATYSCRKNLLCKISSVYEKKKKHVKTKKLQQNFKSVGTYGFAEILLIKSWDTAHEKLASNQPEVWRLKHTNCKLIVTKITVTVAVTWAISIYLSIYIYIYIYLIYNLNLSLLKRYSITGCIMNKSILSKIIKNWDLHFSDTSLEYFVLVLFLVVLITIYVSTCFSSALVKGNL